MANIFHKLTIVIPCYNCADTLEDAVASCYKQNISIPFEIIMVDDCSTDSTRKVMENLSQTFPNIICAHHNENMGGGATRNTAVSLSSGDIIFCLDSDDMLDTGTLGKMVEYMSEKKCDGVAVEYARKLYYKNKNKKLYTTQFGYADKLIPVQSLFERSEKLTCPLYSTFLYTKKAFDVCGGYPTHHAFDTQGFAFRFLMNGFKAYTCPNAVYLQRLGHKSYFIRETEAGRQDHNWLKIFEEFFFIFSEDTQKMILDFDFKTGLDLFSMILAKREVLSTDYADYTKLHIVQSYIDLVHKKSEIGPNDLYFLGTYYFYKKDYALAQTYLDRALKAGVESEHLLYKIFKCKQHISSNSENITDEKILQYENAIKLGRVYPLHRKIIRKIREYEPTHYYALVCSVAWNWFKRKCNNIADQLKRW